jgi:hypothetical protein
MEADPGPTRELDQKHGPAETAVIACDTRQPAQHLAPDQGRGLLRKLTDSFFDFIGLHRVGEPWRNRLRD